MESLRNLYRIGMGPSSSHTMGPRLAAEIFKQRNPGIESYAVTLYGSLAATGKGHLTDRAIIEVLGPADTEIEWCPEIVLPFHPNGMKFCALNDDGTVNNEWTVYSVGGGALKADGDDFSEPQVYSIGSANEYVSWAEKNGRPLWMMAAEVEGPDIWKYLKEVWAVMKQAIHRGMRNEDVLPGGLELRRKARSFYAKASLLKKGTARTGMLSAYALAVSEENAGGGTIVTAPTCGSAGVVPAVLYYLNQHLGNSDETIVRALATAGLFGNIVKRNGSISGAEVGCQGEIGVACAMAAAAVAQIMGATPSQTEYAAEMGLEHFLGLTCDPVMGLVQIPCIERNAMGAAKAMICAEYALLSDGNHRVSFDEVVEVMKNTGHDLPCLYRETSQGGLARLMRKN